MFPNSLRKILTYLSLGVTIMVKNTQLNGATTKMMPILKISRNSLDTAVQLLSQTLGFRYHPTTGPLTVLHSEQYAPGVWFGLLPVDETPEIDPEQLLVFYGSELAIGLQSQNNALWPCVAPHNPYWQKFGGVSSQLPGSWGVVFMPKLYRNYSLFRLARPTSRPFEELIDYYKNHLGLQEIAQFRDHEGFDGITLGILKSLPWHLEFTYEPKRPIVPTILQNMTLRFWNSKFQPNQLKDPDGIAIELCNSEEDFFNTSDCCL